MIQLFSSHIIFSTKIVSEMNFISKLVSILEVTLEDTTSVIITEGLTTELFRFYGDRK